MRKWIEVYRSSLRQGYRPAVRSLNLRSFEAGSNCRQGGCDERDVNNSKERRDAERNHDENHVSAWRVVLPTFQGSSCD